VTNPVENEPTEEAGVGTGAKTVVLLIACLLAVVLAEGALRLFWDNPYGASNVREIVELQTGPKNANRMIDRSPIDQQQPQVAFRTNARGYIEPAIRFPAPDFTVAFLGGSTTECTYVDENMRFPARASILLEGRGLKVNVLNMGVSGNDTHQSINNLLNFVVTDKPDIAVLMEAANDIGHLRATGGYEFTMGQPPSMSILGRLLYTRVSAHSSILSLIRHTKLLQINKQAIDRLDGTNELNLDARRGDLPLEEFKQRIRAFIGIARAFGIRPVVMTQPSDAFRNELTPSWVNQSDQALFNQAIRDVAIEEKADLIDLVAFLKTRQGETGTASRPIFYDGIHVTDYGSGLYAEHVADRLQQIRQSR
jgi:lysophospholipase L1-like esterase